MYNQLISPKVYTLETDRSGRTTKKTNRYGQSSPNPVKPSPTPPTPSVGSFLLLEDGFYMLTEDNFKIIL